MLTPYRRGYRKGYRRGSSGYPLLLQIDVSLQPAAAVEQGGFWLTKRGLPFFGHGRTPVLVDVGEVHTEAQALDVGELEIAIGDVPPVPVPCR